MDFRVVVMVVVSGWLAGCSGRSSGSHREPTAGAPARSGAGGGAGEAGRASGIGGGASGGVAGKAVNGGMSSAGGSSGQGGSTSGGGEGGDPSGGTAGAGSGGQPGVGGSSGGGSSGMPAGGGPSDFPPACVRALTASCQLEGACTFVTTPTMNVERACYASGAVVTYDYSNEGACAAGDETTANVYASDGSLCYTTVRTMGPGCESNTTLWLDAAGNPVATESTPYPGNRTTLTCEDGGGASCGAPCAALRPTCDPGDCPSPF